MMQKLSNSHKRKEKTQCLVNTTSPFYITFTEEIEPIFYILFSKTEAVHSFHMTSVTITPKLDSCHKNRICLPWIQRHTTLQQNNSTLVLATYKINKLPYQLGSILNMGECVSIWKFINIISYIKRLNKKIHYYNDKCRKISEIKTYYR